MKGIHHLFITPCGEKMTVLLKKCFFFIFLKLCRNILCYLHSNRLSLFEYASALRWSLIILGFKTFLLVFVLSLSFWLVFIRTPLTFQRVCLQLACQVFCCLVNPRIVFLVFWVWLQHSCFFTCTFREAEPCRINRIPFLIRPFWKMGSKFVYGDVLVFCFFLMCVCVFHKIRLQKYS